MPVLKVEKQKGGIAYESKGVGHSHDCWEVSYKGHEGEVVGYSNTVGGEAYPNNLIKQVKEMYDAK